MLYNNVGNELEEKKKSPLTVDLATGAINLVQAYMMTFEGLRSFSDKYLKQRSVSKKRKKKGSKTTKRVLRTR